MKQMTYENTTQCDFYWLREIAIIFVKMRDLFTNRQLKGSTIMFLDEQTRISYVTKLFEFKDFISDFKPVDTISKMERDHLLSQIELSITYGDDQSLVEHCRYIDAFNYQIIDFK